MATEAKNNMNAASCCSTTHQAGKDECSTSASDCGCGTPHEHTEGWKVWLPLIVSFVVLAAGMILDKTGALTFFTGYVRLGWYLLSYLIVGFPVLRNAARLLVKGDFFNEFSLMSIATLGALAIGEYPEAVAVMLFYSVGEIFQDMAVNKSRRSIRALLDIRPDTATVLRGHERTVVSPESVSTGEVIEIKAGERIPLDGELLTSRGSFNTSALTGESKPDTIREGGTVLAGMINLENVITLRVTKRYEDSSLARILEMVEESSARKAPTELRIRRFARIYTPLVFGLAVAIILLPALFVETYVFRDWLYRALVFLVISCPCALVVSVPLGYFAGIGAASRKGILFKGANYLDAISSVTTVVMDKTGTLTEGVFAVQQVIPAEGGDAGFLKDLAALESGSNHPTAKAITEYAATNRIPHSAPADMEEIAGMGVHGIVDGREVLAGNAALMEKYGIDYNRRIDAMPETVVMAAIGGRYTGCVVIADRPKEDAKEAVARLNAMGIETVMMSGDKEGVAAKVGWELGVKTIYGGLLPEGKVSKMEEIMSDPKQKVAFVGDGINDAPVLALSDVGIAMGGMGSDAAIEIADVVIQTDQPLRIVTAINISRTTRRIVTQNIVMALGIKALVMILGALGFATMWAAVFADVGVALLAILNSVRILSKKF